MANDPTDAQLKLKRKPAQSRAQGTIDLIVETAAELLIEVGIEDLSTNLICRRAGLSPPALYRYFPNKFAVLAELGQRLMKAQNEALMASLEAPVDLDRIPQTIAEIVRKQHEVTESFTGGSLIMRSLRASPKLAGIRLQSNNEMAEWVHTYFRQIAPAFSEPEARQRARLAIEIGYCAIEMLFDDEAADIDAALQATGEAIAALLVGGGRAN